MKFPTGTLFKVIAFSVVCLLFTGVLGVRLSNRNPLKNYVRYRAEFTNALGVLRGDSVKVAGVDVGRVTDIDIEDGNAVVTFEVDEAVDLPEDTGAAIRWRNVLGQRFLYLYPGEDTVLMAEGDRIPVAQTREAGDIGALLNSLGPILRAIDPNKANAFLDSVNTALSGNEIAARQLLDNAASLASDLGDMDGEIATLVDSSDEVVGAFAAQDQQIQALLDHLNDVGGVLEGSTRDLNRVITNFAVVQRQLDGLLDRNGEAIDSTIANAEVVTHTLAANRERLADTICTLPMGLAGYFQTSSWGEWFNVRIYELIIKDSHNRTIVDQTELPQQRGEIPPPAVNGCDENFHGRGAQAHAKGGLGSHRLPLPGGSTGGPAGIVRFSLEGEGDA